VGLSDRVLIKNFGPEQKIKMEGGESYMKTNFKTSNLV
jgi:hypothetical protein